MQVIEGRRGCSTQEQTEVVEILLDTSAVFVAEHLVELRVDRIGSVQHDGSYVEVRIYTTQARESPTYHIARRTSRNNTQRATCHALLSHDMQHATPNTQHAVTYHTSRPPCT